MSVEFRRDENGMLEVWKNGKEAGYVVTMDDFILGNAQKINGADKNE